MVGDVWPYSTWDLYYKLGFRWEIPIVVGCDDIEGLKGPEGWPALLKIESEFGDHPHCIYVDEKLADPSNFTIIHITDPHLARRNDLIPQVLAELRDKAEYYELLHRYNNFNNNLRAIIRYANALNREEKKLVIVVITGDIVEHFYDRIPEFDDPTVTNVPNNDMPNYWFFYSLITNWDDLGEELECPLFTVLGNHDYLAPEPPLQFTITLLGISMSTQSKFDAFRLTKQEACEYDYWADGCPAIDADPHRKGMDGRIYVKGGGFYRPHLDQYRANQLQVPTYKFLGYYLYKINYRDNFKISLGQHQLLFFNTGWDNWPDRYYIAGHNGGLIPCEPGRPWCDALHDGTHNYGIHRSQLEITKQSLRDAGDEGILFCFFHAPLLNMYRHRTADMEKIYEWPHSCQIPPQEDPSQSNQVTNFLLSMLGDHEYIEFDPYVQRFMENFFGFQQRGCTLGGPRHFFQAQGSQRWMFRFGCAEGEIHRFFQLLDRPDCIDPTLKRKPVLVLSGHTHKTHEFRIKYSPETDSTLVFMDKYDQRFERFIAGAPINELERADIEKLRGDAVGWLQKYSPLCFTSGGLKLRPDYRQIDVQDNKIVNMRSQVYGKYLDLDENNIRYFFIAALKYFASGIEPCDFVMNPKRYVEKYFTPDGRYRFFSSILRSWTTMLAYLLVVMRESFGPNLYAITMVWLNRFGVDFQDSASNSLDFNHHRQRASQMEKATLLGEIDDRLEKIFLFVKNSPWEKHIVFCMWYAYASSLLADYGGYKISRRNDPDPTSHLDWAESTLDELVIHDIIIKYTLQAERQLLLKGIDGLRKFYASSAADLASWGTICTGYESIEHSRNEQRYADLCSDWDDEHIVEDLIWRVNQVGQTLIQR